jgi:soluble lytic murein transglycosylase
MLLDWLIAMDEKVFATKVLKEINSQFKTIAERERAMSLYAQSGWYQGGMIQIYNFPMKMRDELTKKHISVVFPTPYQDIFTKYSEKYKLPKALAYGITRQESAFNPNVRSWADAFGLMQMIPEKATELSKRYNIPYKDFNDLYKPDPNVEMGVALLAELKDMYKGKFAQNVAAYNASTAAIAVWERERFNGDYLEFIEMIPYEETRNYIKLVFRNYMTYKRIMANEEIIIPEDFFAHPYN